MREGEVVTPGTSWRRVKLTGCQPSPREIPLLGAAIIPLSLPTRLAVGLGTWAHVSSVAQRAAGSKWVKGRHMPRVGVMGAASFSKMLDIWWESNGEFNPPGPGAEPPIIGHEKGSCERRRQAGPNFSFYRNFSSNPTRPTFSTQFVIN